MENLEFWSWRSLIVMVRGVRNKGKISKLLVILWKEQISAIRYINIQTTLIAYLTDTTPNILDSYFIFYIMYCISFLFHHVCWLSKHSKLFLTDTFHQINDAIITLWSKVIISFSCTCTLDFFIPTGQLLTAPLTTPMLPSLPRSLAAQTFAHAVGMPCIWQRRSLREET